MTAFAEAERKIGYVFKDKELLTLAFTHSTYSNVHGGENNERLEYLGDAVLQLVVSELLYGCEENGRKFTEGEMTESRQRLVNQKALSAVVEKMGLKEYLLFEGGASNVAKRRLPAFLKRWRRRSISTAASRRQRSSFPGIYSSAARKITSASCKSGCKSAASPFPITGKRRSRAPITRPCGR